MIEMNPPYLAVTTFTYDLHDFPIREILFPIPLSIRTMFPYCCFLIPYLSLSYRALTQSLGEVKKLVDSNHYRELVVVQMI